MRSLVISIALALVSAPAFGAEIIAKSTLLRGTIISASDVTTEPSSGAEAHSQLAAFVGKEVKRTIYAGQKVNPSFVGSPILVKRNSRVTMIYKFGPMEITAFGRALDEGGVGDTVTIMNLDSRNRVNGIVNSAGYVEVNL
ncbi:MAG: flagellar basal body P-ring formation protein FlgA [Acidimicrobiales bacterium]|nr:flagellar basal body P-ring formation protein FlgA [Hyphomonadaceae bacterium]RZV44777.1 MAG: flagellar basal body P-ring formation protein FlgA [Acidimicrobiales bacterium]